MDVSALKLQLIQQALQTDDAQLLQTALRVLQLGRPTNLHTPTPPQQEPNILQQGQPPMDEDVKQLQRDIDELFNL